MWPFLGRCHSQYLARLELPNQPGREVVLRCDLRAGHRESHVASRHGQFQLVVWYDKEALAV